MSKIDYPLERIRAFVFDIDGVLSPPTTPLGDDGIPRRMANMRDGYAMVLARRAGYLIAIITGAVAPGLQERFANIGVNDYFAGSLDKTEILERWIKDNKLMPEEVAYAGDDLPDLGPMQLVGLAVAPADASRDAIMAANYVTDAAGGYGVARELIEEVMRAQGTWPGCDCVAFGD